MECDFEFSMYIEYCTRTDVRKLVDQASNNFRSDSESTVHVLMYTVTTLIDRSLPINVNFVLRFAFCGPCHIYEIMRV